MKYDAKLNERLKSVDISSLQILGTPEAISKNETDRQSQEFEIALEDPAVSDKGSDI